MTWHPLATNPLPEPGPGRVLLMLLSNRTFISLTGEADGWFAGDKRWSPTRLRSEAMRNHPSAQWHLVPAPGEPSEADELWKRVAELEDLVSRAIRCSHRVTSLKVPRWTCVKRVFSVGSTRAHELCRRFGLDPDEIVGGAS